MIYIVVISSLCSVIIKVREVITPTMGLKYTSAFKGRAIYHQECFVLVLEECVLVYFEKKYDRFTT